MSANKTGSADDVNSAADTRTTDDASTPDGTGTADVALATDGLRRTFGEVIAVTDVSLSVRRGELRALIGPNGAGKTTLFNLITGALPPTEGRVVLEGEDITQEPEHERPHRGLARSFQSNQLFTDRTVLENVRVVAQTSQRGAFSLDAGRPANSVGRERAHSLLETVGVDASPETLAKNLPHTDQRRLGIAMALATDPRVLLLDEPTSGMSPDATQATAALIEQIRDELELTVVLIEHDVDVVLSISDRVSVLNRGSVIATESPEEIQDDETVQEAYLGGVHAEL